jgi:20S proteasome alpha/beta subunit
VTICIAAVCEEGKHIVVAVDRMFTAGSPLNLEFEPPISKIEKLGDACVAMCAGNSLYAAELAERIRQHLKGSTGGKNPKMAHVVTFAKEAYVAFRNEKFQEQILGAHLGPDFAMASAKGVSLPTYLKDQPQMYQQMVIQNAQFNLGVEVTFAGCDESGSHISYLANPGTVPLENFVWPGFFWQRRRQRQTKNWFGHALGGWCNS